MTALFKKTKEDKKKEKLEVMDEVKVAASTSGVGVPTESVGKDITGNWAVGDSHVLKGFYVSEKASFLNSANQYVFKVYDDANKAQIKKQIQKVFDVKVRNVKVINTRRKRRDLGRHPGFKPGYKKAIVRLEEGYSIDQAKA